MKERSANMERCFTNESGKLKYLRPMFKRSRVASRMHYIVAEGDNYNKL